MQGFAPRHREIQHEDGKRLVETGFYNAFIRSPIRGAELERLGAPAKGAIELVVDYDHVSSQDIKVL